MPKPLLIARTGSTFSAIREKRGDFDDWFLERFRQLGVAAEVWVANGADRLPNADDYQAVVVTGSPAMVTDREPWSEALAHWLRDAAEAGLPMLGVCYGHQLLAHAFGGEVGYHPKGREIGTHEVQLQDAASDDSLFGGMPSRFVAHLTHAQSVLRLPEQAVLLASNAYEPHQAFRIGERAWGVQFHPEFDAEIMASYLAHFRNQLEQEGTDPEVLLNAVREAPEATSLLARFAQFAERV